MITLAINARQLFTIPLMLSLGVLLVAPASANGQSGTPSRDKPPKVDTEKVAEAGAMFQKNCLTCHQPPDLSFATDRAWLDQLKGTA